MILACLLHFVAVAAAGEARVAPGPVPPEAVVLPNEGLLIGIDVKALFASASWARLASGQLAGVETALPADQADALRKDVREGIAKGLADAEAKTGVRLDRDLDRVVMAGGGMQGKQHSGAVLATGRVAPPPGAAAVQAAQKALGHTSRTRAVEGGSLLVFEEGGKPDFAVSLPDERTLIVGTPASVEQALANRTKGVNALAAAPRLVELVQGLPPDAGLWIAADERVVELAQPAGDAPQPFPLPRSVTFVAGFDGGLELTGEMADEAAARNASDLLRGGIAMVRMQGQGQGPQKPIADALAAITVEQSGRRVRVVASPEGGGAIGLLAGLAVPSLLRSRVTANEAAAIGDVRTVVTAQAAYSSAHAGAYADMACLSDPRGCAPGHGGPSYVDAQLASLADRSGYRRAFFPGKPTKPGARSYRSFAYTAEPLQPGQSGVRSFCGDSSGLVCSDPNGAPIQPAAGACPASCSPIQ